MEELLYLRANTSLRRYRREKLDGRDYYVVPLSMLAPGVLNGSNGPLYYPKEECSRNVQAWNGMPITVYHPTLNGSHVSARTPKVIEKQGIGFVFAANYRGKLRAEGWVDVEKARRVDNRIVEAIENNRPMELSTGLFTDNEPSKGTWNGRAYDYIARNYRPDHLAFLPDQKGACSISDGCGVLVNKNNGETKVKNPGMLKTLAKVLGLIANECDDEDCDGSCGMKHPKDADEDSEQVDNVFCPTGEGGGVDPTCSPSGTSGAGGGKKSKKKKRLPTASELSEFIPADSISRKGDVYTARKQFFYTFGKDAGSFAERVKQSYPGVVVQDFGEVWKPFRGGASTRASSHWWVKFTIKQDEPTENAEGDGEWRTINGVHVFIQGGKITKGPKSLRGKTEAEAAGEQKSLDAPGKGLSETAKSHSSSALGKSKTARTKEEHHDAAAAHFMAAESNKKAAEYLNKSTEPGSGHEATVHESMRSAHQTMGESHLKAAEKAQSTAGGKGKSAGGHESVGKSAAESVGAKHVGSKAIKSSGTVKTLRRDKKTGEISTKETDASVTSVFHDLKHDNPGEAATKLHESITGEGSKYQQVSGPHPSGKSGWKVSATDEAGNRHHFKLKQGSQSTAGGKQKGGGSSDTGGVSKSLSSIKKDTKLSSRVDSTLGDLPDGYKIQFRDKGIGTRAGVQGVILDDEGKVVFRSTTITGGKGTLGKVQSQIEEFVRSNKTNNQDSRSGLSVNRRRKKMAKLTTEQREEIIDRLTANCEECDEDRQIYDGFSDKMLVNLDGKVKAALTANADPDEDEEDDDEEEALSRNSRGGQPRKLTEAEFFAIAPDSVKDLVANSKRMEAKEKARVITRLTANIKDAKARKVKQEKLSGMTMDQLQTMAELMQVPDEEQLGADPIYAPGGPVGNSRELLVNRQTGEKIDAGEWRNRGLEIPAFNWDAEQPGNNGTGQKRQPAEAN